MLRILCNQCLAFVEAKIRCSSFQIFETEDLVDSGFFGSKPIKGLNLPKEVLEKIYYKNAMKLYPGLLERMRRLGYQV
jgi:hypothetical protein